MNLLMVVIAGRADLPGGFPREARPEADAK
jgi:hypothetical protein